MLAAALEPGRPGWLVRRASILPGVAATADQIATSARYWRTEAIDALATDRPLLVALGDSLAQGVGASRPERGYVGLLQRELAADAPAMPVVNLSRSGARILDVLQTQLPALAAIDHPVGLVVCTVGSNDLVRSAHYRRTRALMDRLLDELPPASIVATLPSRGSLTATRLNRHLRRQAQLRGRPVADVGAMLTSWSGRRASDRFHPNDRGYEIWLHAFLAAHRSQPGEPDRYEPEH